MRCAGAAGQEGGRDCPRVSNGWGGRRGGRAGEKRGEGDTAKEEGRWWKIKEVKPKRDGGAGECGPGGNEERRERRTGGGEIISHRLAGAATGDGGGGGADPQLIIPSCLHLLAASVRTSSGRSHSHQEEAKESSTGGVGEAAGPRLAPIGYFLVANSDEGFFLHVTFFSFVFFFFYPPSTRWQSISLV